MDERNVFSKHRLPSDPHGWPLYRKTALTKMIRIDGPFVVETREGPLKCPDGYIALDSGGYPYPIAADEQVKIYEAYGEEVA